MRNSAPTPSNGGSNPPVFDSFDELFQARASAGAFVVPPTQQATPQFLPQSQIPPPAFPILLPSPVLLPSVLSPQSNALISPRYEPLTPQPQLGTPLGTPYSGLVSPRYVMHTTTTVTSTGDPSSTNKHSFLAQPLAPFGSQPSLLQQPSLFSQPVTQPAPTSPHPSLWNPFWEDIKHDNSQEDGASKEDGDVLVHIVEELSDDDSDDDDKDGDKKYRNFQLRTSLSKLGNSDPDQEEESDGKSKVEVVRTTTTTTFKAAPLTKSEEREQLKEGEFDYSKERPSLFNYADFHHHRLIDESERGRERSDSGASLMGPNRTIRFNWHPKATVSPKTMKALIQVNCLVKGQYDASTTKWLIPVDHTPASMRALEYVRKLCDPKDHIFIVHVREWSESDSNLRDAYIKWRGAVKLCRKFKKVLEAAGQPHTILVPVHHDIRKIVVKLAKKFKVDKIAIGKHGPEDKKLRVKNIHFRSFSKYVSKHAKGIHTIIV